jgi:hypothetical protein
MSSLVTPIKDVALVNPNPFPHGDTAYGMGMRVGGDGKGGLAESSKGCGPGSVPRVEPASRVTLSL